MFETDDDDFTPSSSTNLSSIFNASVLSDDSASLSYKAPKQPKALGNAGLTNFEQTDESKVPSVQTQSSVILAKVITLWKLENGQNKLIGKHIVAIIGNAGQHLYEVIVYKEKTNILIRQPLNETLILYKYPKNFIGLFDTDKQFWNIGFDNVEQQESFIKQVCVYKCQIIEQKSYSNTNDQVDNKTENLIISNPVDESVEPKKTEPLTNDYQKNDENSSKDKILSRITKMGRQILPKPNIERKTSTELSDSETESSHSDAKPPKPATTPRKFRRNPNHEKTISTPIITAPVAERNILHSSYAPNANQIFSNNNQMVLNPHSMVYSQPYPDYGVNNFIIAQNAELKANLAEINLKLNTVLNSQGGTVDKNGNSDEYDSLKSKIKCLNLRIENLTTDLGRSMRAFEELKKKYDLQCLEVAQEQEKNERSKNLSAEVSRLKEELGNMEALRVENEKLSMNIKEKDELLESHRLNLKISEDYCKENEHIKENLTKEISELNLKIEELTVVNKEYQKKIKQKENISTEIQKNGSVLNKEMLNKKIKETMNEAFRSIMEQFDENEQYNFKDIQKVVLENLKQTTYSLINATE